MDETTTGRGRGRRYARFFDWVDDRLIPVLGPPPLGPYEADPVVAARPCTVCGRPLSEHVFDRSSSRDHFMYCPVADRVPDPAESSVPVNEFGMVIED